MKLYLKMLFYSALVTLAIMLPCCFILTFYITSGIDIMVCAKVWVVISFILSLGAWYDEVNEIEKQKQNKILKNDKRK